MLTEHDDAVAAAVTSLGGTVTGSVPGSVVQAEMPVDSTAALALAPGVDFVQAPRPVDQRPQRLEAVGFGRRSPTASPG